MASAYTIKVSEDELFKYKLSTAITNKLIGKNKIINGVMYPTVAMYGNAENIVLEPEFVDNSLKLLAIEFIKIVTDNSLTIETIDTATEFDYEGDIKWSGKSFSWTGKGEAKVNYELGDWILADENGKKNSTRIKR